MCNIKTEETDLVVWPTFEAPKKNLVSVSLFSLTLTNADTANAAFPLCCEP